MKKLIYVFLLVVLLSLVPMSIVGAQGETPPVADAAVENPTWTLITVFLGVVIVLFAVAFGGERATEFVKMLLRWLSTKAKWLHWIAPSGLVSMLLALIPAYFAAYQFDINLLTQFELFQNVDPELTKILTAVIVWAVSNALHPQVKAAIPAPAAK